MSLQSPTPAPQQAPVETHKRVMTLGILGNDPDSDETRLFLTPEACGMISSSGVEILMEEKAGIDINYSDSEYAASDVKICKRGDALKADVVISVRPIPVADISSLKKGATLISLMDTLLFEREVVEALLDKKVNLLLLDDLASSNDIRIFARILDEINGRAAILYAQEGLSYLGEGKGVLLSGVAGINPCEVLIIGNGYKLISAARAAMAIGANVTLMDNDVAALYKAQDTCNCHLQTSVIHPHVLFNKVKSADVILLDKCTNYFEFPKQLSVAMKDSVYLLDLRETTPSLSVPRTVAMGISNPLIHFFEEMTICGGANAMIATNHGVQKGVAIYQGHLTDKIIGMRTSLPTIDLKLLLAQSN